MCYNQNNHYLSLIGVTPVFPRKSLMTRVFRPSIKGGDYIDLHHDRFENNF